MIQSMIKQWTKKAPNIPASTHRLCALFGISRSWYYEVRKRADEPPAPRYPACPLRAAVQSVFKDSGRSYGSLRICAGLRAQGLNVEPLSGSTNDA